MGVNESLSAVVKAFPQARLVAFADLSSRMILSSAGKLSTTQEHLDRLCDQARASFDDPLFSLSVDAFGEPHSAVIMGLSGGATALMRSGADDEVAREAAGTLWAAYR